MEQYNIYNRVYENFIKAIVFFILGIVSTNINNTYYSLCLFFVMLFNYGTMTDYMLYIFAYHLHKASVIFRFFMTYNYNVMLISSVTSIYIFIFFTIMAQQINTSSKWINVRRLLNIVFIVINLFYPMSWDINILWFIDILISGLLITIETSIMHYLQKLNFQIRYEDNFLYNVGLNEKYYHEFYLFVMFVRILLCTTLYVHKLYK